MRIVVAGGRTQADFLIGTLAKKKHKLIVINDDQQYCDYLASTHKIPVVYGDPSKYFVLEEAGIRDFDVIIPFFCALASIDSSKNIDIVAGNRVRISIRMAVGSYLTLSRRPMLRVVVCLMPLSWQRRRTEV